MRLAPVGPARRLSGGQSVAGAGEIEMSGEPDAQAILEDYLRGELTLDAAADRYVEVLKKHKKGKGDPSGLSLRKPEDWDPDHADLRRAKALFEELDRRLASG